MKRSGEKLIVSNNEDGFNVNDAKLPCSMVLCM